MSDTMNIRPLQDSDLPAVADLLNRTDFIPASEGYPISPEGLKRHLEECGTVLFLVAESQEQQAIVGTLSLNAVSEQRVASPREVFATALLVHPEFRSGSIPNQLFIMALRTLLRDGYDCLSATVNPANIAALSLYKRIGLYRTRSCSIDYDGQLELRGYQPLIVRAMNMMRLRQTKDGGLTRPTHGWRFLTPPSGLRECQYDTEFWHGLEVATYEMHADDWQLLFRVDVQSNGLVEMQTEQVHFRFYPEQGSEMFIGDTSSLILELTNLAPESRTYGVSLEDFAPGILPARVFQPGETWRQAVPLSFTRCGRQEFHAILQMEQCALDFRTGVNVHPDVKARRIFPQLPIVAHEPWQIPVQLTNARPEPLEGTIRVNSPTLPIIHCTQEVLAFSAKEVIELTLTGPQAPAGTHHVTIQLVDAQGQVHSAEPLVIPVSLAEQALTYREQDSWIVESAELSLQIACDTGYLRLWERKTGALVLREPWPDLGPPVPGGLKRSHARTLTCLSMGDTETGTMLVIEESLSNGERLQRSLRFLNPRLLEIQHRWFPASGNTDGNGQRSKVLRTLGWCMFRKAMLTVPLHTGWQTRPVIYGEYPFMRHELETIPFSDLPFEPDAYAASWSAFTEGERTIGTLWEEASEVRFGGYWMPSLLYTLPTSETKQGIALPRYAYYVGPGDARTIANISRQWQRGETIPLPAIEQTYRIPESSLAPEAHHYEQAFLAVIEQEAKEANAEITVNYKEKQDSYLVDNGLLCWQVSPGFAGSITSLTYRGMNLLQSAYPRPRLFGNHNPWYGGIHPAQIEDRSDLLQGLVSDVTQRMDFQAVECEEVDRAGNQWRGITLKHKDLSFAYETIAGLPLLRLSLEMRNTQRATRTCELFFNVFLRGLQGSRGAKVLHYERAGETRCLTEGRRLRHVYADGWSIVELGKETYVAIAAPLAARLEVATYEWSHDGFQQALLHPFKVAPNQSQRVSSYLWITHSLEQALVAIKALQHGEGIVK